jgi:bifunctional non-homologous end joining protein LigD
MRAETAEMIQVDGHQLRIRRVEKVLFPEDGITKGDLIRYYQRIGPWMLPHLEGRPLALQRYPDGIDQPGFFQKAAAPYYPSWIRKVTVKKVGGTVKHVVCEDTATLVYLANQACITLHTWLSRADRPNIPDQMIFDFDPAGDDFDSVIAGAQSLKAILDEMEWTAFVKATGSRGLHVAVPIEPKLDFDSVRSLARAVAERLVAQDPDRYTLEQYKAKRGGRVLIDINRNAYAQTAVAPYTVRARRGAPIAVPLRWSEIRKEGFRSDAVTIRSIFDRLEQTEDPWKDFWQRRASLHKVRRKFKT